MLKRRLSILCLLCPVCVLCVSAQRPAFDVASVKTNHLDDHIVTINVGPGPRFSAKGYTLVLLMQRAYGVMDWNVEGGPGWIRTDRFDVTAVAPTRGDLTETQLQSMLQALLAERFGLRVHKTTKEMAGYALTVARGGPKLTPAADPVEHPDSFRLTNTGLTGDGISMENFARFVGGKLALQPAVDQTNLPGAYDVKADWTVQPELATGLPTDPRDPLRNAVMNAIEEQLGLKLVARRVPVQVIVIDRVELPTED